ncbi:DMT family transporter [Leucothrix pacifica]|uniref:EamA family transporter n=1 Tax=Leucothrix pacifica TaxID=1247513 RepID=A0A317CP10_9GAMM|nr:DMT family transporter [Leucothrix pacifica]PWQ99891.1 EamA family transporter [Leucothrix pacifica]
MSSLRQDQTRGIQLMLLGCILLPLMDAAAKYMGETISSGLIVLGRFAFQSLFLLPFVWSTLYLPKGRELALHLMRSFSIAVATVCFFTAIQVMPIADALAIFFVMPLIVTLLAPWVLGESVGWRRLVAVFVGLLGAVIIIQPGHALFGARALLPLMTALAFSFYLMFTRKLARVGSETHQGSGVAPLTMQFYSGLFGSLIMITIITVMQPFEVSMFTISLPEPWQWRQLVLVGFLAAVGHLVVTTAFKYADASILAPFQYIELISAALLGWWLFDDIPAVTTWIGATILVASGLYIFHREREAATL